MLETLDKIMLAGLGALSMTRKRAQEIFDQAVRRGQAQRGHQAGFVKDLMDGAERTRKDLSELVAKQVHEALVKLNVPTRDELLRLEGKIDKLLAQRKESA
jgi:poly(hydroxyalkanoate) granule-associated protein